MNKSPKNIKIEDYLYNLPDEKIAKYPLQKRDESKLLVFEKGVITETIYFNLALKIPEKSLLVFNNTKVVEARLLFKKDSGSIIEIFCLEPSEIYADITSAMLEKSSVQWKCLIGGAKKWKDETLTKQINELHNLSVHKIEKKTDYFLIEFNWSNSNLTFAEILHLAGEIPLPPYLNRNVEENDKLTYQTIYATENGSVAAPTAGLHFTDSVFNDLKNKKIKIDFVTLHVGAGTFKPVKAPTIQEHEMHAEFIEVELIFIENVLQNLTENIIAIGTTSLRTIESLYWIGVKLISNKIIYEKIVPEVFQWDAYELPQNISAIDSFNFLIGWMKNNSLKKIITKTQIIIAPGYKLKIANGLITNFHQPKSTLLLLIAAIVGDDWKKIYQHALENNYRFLSYGDGCLLWNN